LGSLGPSQLVVTFSEIATLSFFVVFACNLGISNSLNIELIGAMNVA